jgi:hypothetical protein
MSYSTKIRYSTKQKAEIWGRWQRGESMKGVKLIELRLEIESSGRPSDGTQ